ncbi:MAG: AI-2E family transporter [Fibrobacterota bacterium]
MTKFEEPENHIEFAGKYLQAAQTKTRILPIITIISASILVWMLQSILAPFIFACILATLTWPLREKIQKMTGNRSGLTSGILIMGMIALIGAPIGGILLLAVSQAQELFSKTTPQQAYSWLGQQRDRLDHLPLANQLGFTSDKLLPKLQDGMSDIASWGMNMVVGVGSNIIHTLVLLGITLMSLYYLYVSGENFVVRTKRLLPLPESQVSDLLEVFRRTSKAIFKGNFVIGACQGLLTGLLFWGTGLPSPVFFGVIAAFASLIPAVGSGLVWVPALLYFVVSADFTRAAVVLGVGMGVISTLDNVLRPTLVGRDAGMHDLMVFLTTIGGISFFGPAGVLFGPLVGAGVLAMLRLYEESRKTEVANEPGPELG